MKVIFKISYLLIVIIIAGCTAEGDIKVYNKTSEWLDVSIDGDYYYLNAYEYAKKSYDLDDNIFSHEERDVTVSGEGLVKWGFSENYTVKPDETKKVNIYADCSAIKIYNNSYNTIVSIYLSPSSDTEWGNDDLSGYIYPGEVHSWRISTGYWDIKVVDEYYNYATSFDNYIGTGVVYMFTYYFSLAKKNTDSSLKNKENFQFDKPTNDRVEKYGKETRLNGLKK